MAPGTPANPVDRRFTRAEFREKYRYAEGTLGKSRAEARAMIDLGQLCFRAGTLVHTLSGLKPIEAIEIGDVVLSRDVKHDYNRSRLLRYLQYGDGNHNAFVQQLLQEQALGQMESFSSFYRGRRIYELPLGWPSTAAFRR